MDDTIEMVSVGSFGFKIPAHLKESVKPHNYLRNHHGYDSSDGDAYICDACGACSTLEEVVETGLSDPRCHHCNKYLQRRCAADGCDNFSSSKSNNDSPPHWYVPPTYCKTCRHESLREARTSLLESIPERIRHSAVKSWEGRYKHRKAAGEALSWWLLDDCGRKGKPVLYLWGNVGSGKTTVAARGAIKAVMEGHAKNLMWVKESDVVHAAKSEFSRDESHYMLKQMMSADLLVYDELWCQSDTYTDNVRARLNDIFSRRFEEMKPTLITSNEPTSMFSDILDARIASRFKRASKCVEVRGPDLRMTND